MQTPRLSQYLGFSLKTAEQKMLVTISFSLFSTFSVRPHAGAVGENFILMDDNAHAHRACITDQYLEQATIVRMEWPARSPDLNPIEHAWDMLQTAVSSRPMQPASVQELRQALLEEWDQIPQYKIRRLISSMQRRCQAVIGAWGHHTRY